LKSPVQRPERRRPPLIVPRARTIVRLRLSILNFHGPPSVNDVVDALSIGGANQIVETISLPFPHGAT
jgi:hypothetical protein